MTDILISDIVVTGWNPRKSFDQKKLEELSESIKHYGVLEPLVVRQINGSYELVAGERRLRAAKLAGLEKVPVVVKDITAQEAREIMLMENLQRQDLNPLEDARALKTLLEEGGITQAELGKKLGKSQAWVANRLRLLRAPAALKEMVISREITPKHVTLLLPYTDYPVYKEDILPNMIRKIRDNDRAISVTQLKNMIANSIIYDYNNRYVLNLSDFSYDITKYHEFFDFSSCKGCRHIVIDGDGDDEEKEEYCLNRSCWKDKLNIAKQKYREQLTHNIDEKVDTSKLKYDDYHFLGCGDFDQTECQGCTNNKQNLRGDSICIDAGCFIKKRNAWKREQNRKIREEAKKASDFLDEKLSEISSLGEKELRFILHSFVDFFYDVEMALKPWGGKSEVKNIKVEELPRAILRTVFFEKLNTRYSTLTIQSVSKVLTGLEGEGCIN